MCHTPCPRRWQSPVFCDTFLRYPSTWPSINLTADLLFTLWVPPVVLRFHSVHLPPSLRSAGRYLSLQKWNRSILWWRIQTCRLWVNHRKGKGITNTTIEYREYRQSPLFLSLFSTILPNSRVTSSILWTLCDAVGAWALIQIWRARQRVRSSPRDNLVGALWVLL